MKIYALGLLVAGIVVASVSQAETSSCYDYPEQALIIAKVESTKLVRFEGRSEFASCETMGRLSYVSRHGLCGFDVSVGDTVTMLVPPAAATGCPVVGGQIGGVLRKSHDGIVSLEN